MPPCRQKKRVVPAERPETQRKNVDDPVTGTVMDKFVHQQKFHLFIGKMFQAIGGEEQFLTEKTEKHRRMIFFPGIQQLRYMFCIAADFV